MLFSEDTCLLYTSLLIIPTIVAVDDSIKADSTIIVNASNITVGAVSYTHLDVYKRQGISNHDSITTISPTKSFNIAGLNTAAVYICLLYTSTIIFLLKFHQFL